MCGEFSQTVLGIFNVIDEWQFPTPYFEPYCFYCCSKSHSFRGPHSDFLLFEEADSFLALEDDPTSSEVDPTYQDPEGDILLLEAILNSEPPPPLLNQEQYMLKVRICSNFADAKTVEPSLMNLRDLKDEEKAALLKVLKSTASHRWKLSDIKGSKMYDGNLPDMIEKTMEVFMDDFSVFGDSFSTCLTHLEKMLKRCEDTNLSLNWEKSHFMIKEGIVLDTKFLSWIEVD
ncbi:hypothetical protein Tco_1294975 [Tanacetum coccineum]